MNLGVEDLGSAAGRSTLAAMANPPDDVVVLHDGPWSHRFVSANGSRFHVVEAGAGPLVLLLHGFPEYWWTWRHQIEPLAEAGYRVAAVDLRGYGASDKPPRGYDGFTLASDVSGLIRALGERDAMLVGHDWGGALAWATAAFHPRQVRRMVILGSPHPLRLRAAIASDPRGQLAASRTLFAFQTPRYEHRVTANDAAYVGALFEKWAGGRWQQTDDYAEYTEACRTAIRIPQAAFCAMEYYRWSLRSLTRPTGWRYAKLMQAPITAPTLQLHGAEDAYLLPRTAQGSGRYVTAGYEWQVLDDVGHFPQSEQPERVTGELLRWAKA
ncbi:Pimeloyl-ACP methyl ester carboxylesterase [Cryptosporangium aurantiacum]|uniref:Pimeloyl-ACP methyl ester carboxylesterase n=2 Tax=Cryptosporangium aurantiacum TaxID=134849 RepID=A0A1M7NGZ7_9ACTN|nr:Pimeloyl-ACP methyl ester carboxylesterase [Cryptosporangium aurantiacum]